MNNLRVIANTLFAIFCAIICHSKSFAEPLNPDTAKTNLRNYYHSGLYAREIEQVATKADQYITHEAALNAHLPHPKKLAIVLDIDETSLSYYNYIEKMNFFHNHTKSDENILKTDAPAIKPILKLYRDALNHHVSVFFVTARHAYLYQATVRNLKHAGFRTWAGLYMLPKNHTNTSMASYKTNIRRNITQKGFTIIASIGDQASDLSGGYLQKGFKLPNPFYHID